MAAHISKDQISLFGKEAGRLSGYLLFAIIISLFLTACTTRVPELVFPEQLNFQGKTYQQVTDNRLGEMRQSLYLLRDSDKNPEQWQQGILLFSDRNTAEQTLAQRLATRQQHTATTQAAIDYHLTQGELRSQGVYLPTERFPNVQLEVTRGRNLSCGYGQMQVAQKQKFAKTDIFSPPCDQQLQQLATQFNQLAWQLECR
ncbi:MAG: ABC transporter ATPase [Pasteurellaceae bacterium]|nr:ABC transporter ATPase [Pasteurellaceae bacterium]